MKEIILDALEESLSVTDRFVRGNLDKILTLAERSAAAIAAGNKILLFGNGGSAADAQHIAAEFVNRFQVERPPLPALALTTDTSVLTSIGNDYTFEDIFAKQIRALGKRDDIAVGISTSGNSPNVLQAIQTAKTLDLYTVGFSGPVGKLADFADLAFAVEAETTARIQEAHGFLGHILCNLVDRILFPEAYGEKGF